MVPLQALASEENGRKECEDDERDNLLHHLELHQREGASVACETYSVGGNLAGVLGQRNAPREYDDEPQWPRRDEFHLLQLQVAIPREGHKYVGYYQQ